MTVRLARAIVRALTRRPAPDRVPDFPLRCQHCSQSIGLATMRHPTMVHGQSATYRDRDGAYVCDRQDRRIWHKPMPSVLN